MEDFEFDLGLRRPSQDSSRLKSGIKAATVPAARIGEALASTALGGTVPQAIVGLANLGSEIIAGQPGLPSYEEIYSKAIPSLKTIPRAAESVQGGITSDLLKRLGVSQSILDRYNFEEQRVEAQKYGQRLTEMTPDIGPLAPPSKLREEVTKPLAGKLTEPESRLEHGLSNVSELAGFLANPSKWTSPANALLDIAKAGGKAGLAKAGGKVGESVGGEAGGALAELLTLSAVGAAENRGLVNSVKQAGYNNWQNFINSKIAQEKPSHFIKGPLKKKLRRYVSNLSEGRGEADPTRSRLINEAGQALEELTTSPKGSTLAKIRNTINNIYNEIPKGAQGNHQKLIGIIDEGLGNWSKHIPGGKQAFAGLQNANAIHQGQKLTQDVGNLMRSYMKSGKVPYAAGMFAFKPVSALAGLKHKPIRSLWWKAWQEGAKGKTDAMQSTLRALDNTIAKQYPNFAQEAIFGRPGEQNIETEAQQEPNDFEFTV